MIYLLILTEPLLIIGSSGLILPKFCSQFNMYIQIFTEKLLTIRSKPCPIRVSEVQHIENRTFSHNSANFFSHYTEPLLIITELFLTSAEPLLTQKLREALWLLRFRGGITY